MRIMCLYVRVANIWSPLSHHYDHDCVIRMRIPLNLALPNGMEFESFDLCTQSHDECQSCVVSLHCCGLCFQVVTSMGGYAEVCRLRKWASVAKEVSTHTHTHTHTRVIILHSLLAWFVTIIIIRVRLLLILKVEFSCATQ